MRIKGFLVFLFALSGITAAQTPDSSALAGDESSVSEGHTTVPSDSTVPSDTLDVAESASTTDTSSASTEQQPSEVPDTPVESDSAPKAQGPVIEEIEEDLILDGGEESILAPVVTQPPVQPLSDTSDSVASQIGAGDSATATADSVTPGRQPNRVSRYPTTPAPTIAAEDTSKPLMIEKTQSINFAKNFKEYRSPKVAILLSLLVPGAGQAYSRNILKAGIFGFVEVAFIAAGAIVGYQGNQKMKSARSFADDNYSLDSLERYHDLLTGIDPDYDSIVFDNFTEFDDFKKEASKKSKSQTYYNLISHQVSPYIQGWEDVTPRFDNNFEPVYDSDSLQYIVHESPDSQFLVIVLNNQGDTVSQAQYGFSDNQREFNRMLSNANSYFRWSKGLFSMLLINHIISAIDAGITAKAYNDKLLGKTSFWQNINIRNKSVSTLAGTAQGYALEVRF